MSLSITDINFDNFRNYQSFHVSELDDLVIFIGPNAVGKTNIIEGIQLLTAYTSFKNPTSEQMILWGTEYSHISIDVKDEIRDLTFDIEIKKEQRKYSLNKKEKRSKELRGIIPSVLFSPDDLCLVKGSHSIKRAALDALGVQLNPHYYVVKKDYEKIVAHKNKLLKEECPDSFLESVNEIIIKVGTQFYCYRNALFQKLKPYISSYYSEITDNHENAELVYIPSWDSYNQEIESDYSYSKEEATQLLTNVLNEKKDEEKIRRRSLVGPHADKLDFFIKGKNAGLYGSQGQQRSLVLCFKLAEVSLIDDILNQKPILLLDDVMSELDSARREALLSFIQKDIQTFITTTHLEYFNEDILKRARIIQLPLDKNKEGDRK